MALVMENARYVSRSIPDGTGRLIRRLSRSSIGIADAIPPSRTALFPAKVFIIFQVGLQHYPLSGHAQAVTVTIGLGCPAVQLRLTSDQIHTGSESRNVNYGAKEKKRNGKYCEPCQLEYVQSFASNRYHHLTLDIRYVL